MTFICGGMMAIGKPHGLRSGVDGPDQVLILRQDKRTAWKRMSSPINRSRHEPKSPSWLWLDTQTYTDYNFRYILTDALIWWGACQSLGLDPTLAETLRTHSKMEEVENDEGKRRLLGEARDVIENATLTGSVSLLITVASGDQPDAVFPPPSDVEGGLLENLRNLDVQYELCGPIAHRMIPGMGSDLLEKEIPWEGGRSLDLF